MARKTKKALDKKPCPGCLLCTGRTVDPKLIPVLRPSRPPLRLFIS